jgi:lysyl-tRNA synthetase class 2
MPTEAELIAARRRKAQDLRERGVELFPARVPRQLDSIPEIVRRYGEAKSDALETASARGRIAGRIVGLRSFGKAAFVVVQGDGVRLQLWFRKDRVGEERYDEFRMYDLGDFVWAEGPLIRTKTDELTVDVESFGLLAKAFRPLPEKWHGLTDVEARFRQRHLDLLVNPRAREIAVVRSRVTTAIRAFLDAREFLEVETPVLQPIYGGATARPFMTHHHTYDTRLYLRISDELYLKRLLVGGFDRVYEICRDFRNEGIDRTHSPEFTMLEAYQAYADYEDMMELLESLVSTVAQQVLGTTRIEWDGHEIELAPPWPRRSMSELIRDGAGIDIEKVGELEALRQEVRNAQLSDVDPQASSTWGRLVDDIFSATVEPNLAGPVFVVDYPVELSPLAKRAVDRPGLVERFEAYLGGMEIANAFTELNDPEDQRSRFEEQAKAKSAGDEDAHPVDEEFIEALEQGMPPTGGIGMGLGRLVMLLTGAPSLREVELFPTLRTRDE